MNDINLQPKRFSNSQGFTLIELFVVISVLAVLAGMAMPMLGLARSKAAKTNTTALLTKIEAALEQFKGELGAYPFKRHDTSSSDEFVYGGGVPVNNLARTLATNYRDLPQLERDRLQADLAAARDAYMLSGAHALTKDDVDPRLQEAINKDGIESFQRRRYYAKFVNRLATQRATMAILAGNTDVTGIHGKTTSRRNIEVITAQGQLGHGYTYDYLSSDLNEENLSGSDLVDFWGQPLLYVCPVVQGVVIFYPNIGLDAETLGGDFIADEDVGIDPTYYGMETTGRAVTTSLDSDLRTEAGSEYARRYELWSSGEDKRITPRRQDAANKDNLAVTNYHQGLK